ncbi:MAG: hypothetical protein ABWK05_07155 [Pyrobaculum sp.]
MSNVQRNGKLGLAIALVILIALIAVWYYYKGGGAGGGGSQPPSNTTTPSTPGVTHLYPTQRPSGYVGVVYVPADAVCNSNTCTITKTAYGYYDAFFPGSSVTGNATIGVVRIRVGNAYVYPFVVGRQGGLMNFTSGPVEFRSYGTYAYAYYKVSDGWIGVYMRVGNVSNVYYAVPGSGTEAPDRTLLARIEIDMDRGIVYINGQTAPYEMVSSAPNTAVNYVWVAHIAGSGTYVVQVNP